MSRFRRRAAGSTAASSASDDKSKSRPRHAIFYDVENKSSPDDVARVMAEIAVDRAGLETHLVAVGNWRVIGQETARLLASHGAELVHSAPSTGVRDWSDLRIAVDAGIWLGTAKPGDMLHIVSDDQAFDAVGDVAATLGVKFERVKMRRSHRPVVAAPVHHPRRRSSSTASRSARTSPRASAPPPTRSTGEARAGEADEKRHASTEEILSFVRRLSSATSSGGTTLDALSNALKDAGFGRPPGSLRLITRLKRMKELQVGPDGVISLVGHTNGTSHGTSRTTSHGASHGPREASGDGTTPRKRTRRGRRGGRRRNGRSTTSGAEAPTASEESSPPTE